MKKIIALLMLTCVLFTLVACNMQECDFCGEKKNCDTEEYYGEKIYICHDCEEELEDLGDMFEDLIDEK